MLSVLLDTSFFIRLLNDTDPLHSNAKEYYKHFLENDIIMKMSTVSIAEFCVRDEIENLPLDTLQILPFNLEHAKVAGQFARAIFKQKNITGIEIKPRAIIPNDSNYLLNVM